MGTRMATPSLESGRNLDQGSGEALRPVPVRAFETSDAERWDRFVYSHPQGTFFHLVGWKQVIEKTFGFEACYFYAERDAKITGIAPVFVVSNWILGRALISVPLAVYGGICAADAESEQALLDHLKQLGRARQVDFIELRNRNGSLLLEFHPNPRYVTFSTRLWPDWETNWKRLPADTRYMIRKARKANLSARHGLNQLADFYRLFAISMRRHGTPVFPKALFQNLVEECGDRMDLMLVYASSRPVAGVLSFLFRDTIMPFYAGAAPEATWLAANNFMYWELMNSAAQSGFSCFDFGRSRKDTGSYLFKMSWNMNVEPLNYQVHLVRRKTVPNFSPANPSFELATRVWRRLPLPLTGWVGPRIARWFP